MIILTRKCSSCGEVKNIACDAAGVQRWQAGEHIQVALSEVSADDRELLISGMCGKCFDELFSEEYEEDEDSGEEDSEAPLDEEDPSE